MFTYSGTPSIGINALWAQSEYTKIQIIKNPDNVFWQKKKKKSLLLNKK